MVQFRKHILSLLSRTVCASCDHDWRGLFGLNDNDVTISPIGVVKYIKQLHLNYKALGCHQNSQRYFKSTGIGAYYCKTNYENTVIALEFQGWGCHQNTQLYFKSLLGSIIVKKFIRTQNNEEFIF